MLETFSAHEKSLGVILTVMNEVPKFKPDNKTTALVEAIIGSSSEVRSEYLEKDAELKTVRAQLHSAWNIAHQAAISVYPTMQSIYRNDAAARQAISKLPVDDRTPAETVTRLESISKQWAELPNMPGTNKTFVAGELDKAAFDALTVSLKEKVTALAACELQFKARAAALNTQDEENESFIKAAVRQGRAQFPEGSEQRRVIEGIPTPAKASPTATEPATPVAVETPKVVTPAATTPTAVDFTEPPKAANQ